MIMKILFVITAKICVGHPKDNALLDKEQEAVGLIINPIVFTGDPTHLSGYIVSGIRRPGPF
jgi:hypothetical protein